MSIQYIRNSKGKKTGVFIPITEWNRLKEILGFGDEDIEEPTKEEAIENLKMAIQQVKDHKEGKTKLKSARELLDEL